MPADTNTDVEFQFNPRRAVANVDAFAARAAELSRQTRARREARLDLRYDAGPLGTLDVFSAVGAGQDVHVYLHGGYWRGRDKSDYSYVADALVPLGITTVVLNYDLCPSVELPQIVAQVRTAFQWVASHLGELGGGARGFTASGHSAGAHLIAAALSGLAHDEPPPPWAPRAAVLVSGIYELEPVLSISVNEEIRLRAEQVDAMSPMRHPPHPGVPLFIVVGGGETAGFIDQSRRFAQVCVAQGSAAAYAEIPARDHYSIMQLLERPDDLLSRLIAGAAAQPLNP